MLTYKIEEGINNRIEHYKKEREAVRKQQKNYKWTKEETHNGSEAYGRLQEKEAIFNIRIFELEYALSCVKYAKTEEEIEAKKELLKLI